MVAGETPALPGMFAHMVLIWLRPPAALRNPWRFGFKHSQLKYWLLFVMIYPM